MSTASFFAQLDSGTICPKMFSFELRCKWLYIYSYSAPFISKQLFQNFSTWEGLLLEFLVRGETKMGDQYVSYDGILAAIPLLGIKSNY